VVGNGVGPIIKREAIARAPFKRGPLMAGPCSNAFTIFFFLSFARDLFLSEKRERKKPHRSVCVSILTLAYSRKQKGKKNGSLKKKSFGPF